MKKNFLFAGKVIFSIIAVVVLVGLWEAIRYNKDRGEKKRIELEDKNLFIDIINYTTQNYIKGETSNYSETGGASGSAWFQWYGLEHDLDESPGIVVTYDAYIHQTMGYHKASETGNLSFIEFLDVSQLEDPPPDYLKFEFFALWAATERLQVFFDMVNIRVIVRIIQGSNSTHIVRYKLASLDGILQILKDYNKIDNEELNNLKEQGRLAIENSTTFEIYKFDNGDVYEGDWIDGERTGKGKYTWSNGEVYEGDWVSGEMTGKGKYSYSTGGVYEGEWLDSKRHGKGKHTWSNGEVYEGDWVSGEMTGKGKYSYSTGTVYEGEWLDSKRHGQGKQVWPDGAFYDGDWLDGKMHGKGRAYDPNDKSDYEGDFVNNLFHGKGKNIFADGAVHEGNWKNGVQHGQGKLTNSDGSTISGEWENGKMIIE